MPTTERHRWAVFFYDLDRDWIDWVGPVVQLVDLVGAIRSQDRRPRSAIFRLYATKRGEWPRSLAVR